MVFISYGLLFDAAVNLWKPFSTKFLERLGGGSLEISLLNGLPGLVAAAVLLPGAVFIARFPKKKHVTAVFILVSRAILMLIAFVPFLPAAAQPLLFVLLVAFMNCPDALSQTSLQSFLGDVFEGPTRAQAITLRNKFGNAVVPVITLLTGLAITFIPRNDAQRIQMYQLFFVGAFGVGLYEVFVFRKFNEHKQKAAPMGGGSASFRNINIAFLRGILKDKKFMSYIAPVLLFTFFWQAGWPICGIFQVQNLNANEFWFAVIALTSGLGAFLTAGLWQKMIRKHGNAFTLIVSTAILAVNLIFYMLSPNVYVLALISPIGGIATLGFNSAMLNGVLESTPDENRLAYIAFYNTLVSISLFVAPLTAHFVLARVGINLTFIILAIGRLFGSAVIYWVIFRRPRQHAPA